MSVNGVQMGMGSLWHQSAVYAPRRPATTAPVEPVGKAPAVEQGRKAQVYFAAEPRLPEIREGADPVEMAVRGRIQYLSPDKVHQMMEEGECQTCESRKYQDGSDDPGVSFKIPTKLDPQQAAAAVRSHEMEHVVREQAKAQREDRRVVQQSVTLHNEICPECGKVYVAGGETRTVTKANPQQPQQDAMFGLDVVA